MTVDEIRAMVADSGITTPPATASEQLKREYLSIQLLTEIAVQLAAVSAAHMKGDS